MIYCCNMQTPIGVLWLTANDDRLCAVSLACSNEQLQETAFLNKAKRQFEEYFNGTRKTFNLPLYLKSTPFTERVWQALCEIPYAQTRSYKQIANAVASPRACRAVGMANHRNPLMIIVPCHRVIGNSGKLIGYGGGLDVKEKLLKLESENI